MKKYLPLSLFILSISCSDKKLPEPAGNISDSPTSLHYDQDFQYVISNGTTTADPSTYIWESGDRLVATVSNSGLLEGRKIGTTTITAHSKDGKNSFTRDVNVYPYSQLCKEPIVEWGALPAFVKSAEERTLVTENATTLLFSGENSKIRNIAYLFESGRLKSSALLLSTDETIVKETLQFMEERYPDFGIIEGNAVFLNDERTSGVIVGVNPTLGFFAIYSAYDDGGRMKAGHVKETISDFETSINP